MNFFKKKAVTPFIALLIAVVCTAGSCLVTYQAVNSRYETAEAQTAPFQQAIQDAVIAEEDEILPLVEITKESDMVTWNASGDKVLMLTFHKYPDSYPDGADVTTQWGYVWVFSEKEFLSRYPELGKVDDWNLRLNQLLGMPESSGQTHVTAMWVSPDDLIRPAYVTDITRQMQNHFDDEQPEDPAYIAWFNDNAVYSYCGNKYPWTRLGYTYDWAENGKEYGVSEFLVKNESELTVEFTKTLDDFIAWADAQAGK